MKWFSHDNNLRNQPEFSKMQELFVGPIGYGFALMIWEIVCQYGDDDFKLPIAGKFDWEFWERELGFRNRHSPGNKGKAAVWTVLTNAAASGVIDNDAFTKEKVVWVPALRERLDEYAKAKLKAAEKFARAHGENPPVPPKGT